MKSYCTWHSWNQIHRFLKTKRDYYDIKLDFLHKRGYRVLPASVLIKLMNFSWVGAKFWGWYSIWSWLKMFKNQRISFCFFLQYMVNGPHIQKVVLYVWFFTSLDEPSSHGIMFYFILAVGHLGRMGITKLWEKRFRMCQTRQFTLCSLF